MSSIEQDELFNAQDNDEEMNDEEEEEERHYLEDEEMGGEVNEDGEEDEEEDEDEEVEEEEEEEDVENEDGDNENENEDEDEDDEEEEEEEDGKFMDARESQPLQSTNSPQEAKSTQEDVLMADDDEDSEDKKRKSNADKDAHDTEEDPQKAGNEENGDNNSGQDSESKLSFREQAIAKARIATEFDIVPSVAIPYSGQCHSLAFSEGPKWILTGGEDGFIRKYDFIASIQGKSPLTMAQKHNMVDSITKAGVIASYWENEQPLSRKQLMAANPKIKSSDFATGLNSYEPKVNPVYALDVERNGYWCLSGLLSGGISLYTMRYSEGNIQHYFQHGTRSDNSYGHNDAVSVIRLNTNQDKFLSGSWDKTIRNWDLNTGKITTLYDQCSGQISNIQYRPLGLSDLVLSEDVEDVGDKNEEKIAKENDDHSEIDSLFGDSDGESDSEQKAQEKTDKPAPKPSWDSGKSTKTYKNDDVFMSSSIDGTINVWDLRSATPALRLGVPEGVPPWCMSSTWSNSGDLIYAGRRNSTVEEFSIRMPHKKSTSGTSIPNVSKVLQFPKISGPVSAISTMPNNDFLLCGSKDNIRLYNLKLYDVINSTTTNTKKPATPFLIIPGHQGGILSNLHVDDTGRFMISASGNRGWGHSNYTDTVLVYEIDFEG